MCTVSAVGDNWKQVVWPTYPNPSPIPSPVEKIVINPVEVTKKEFEALKKEVEELKKLLLAAKRFDEATGQPDCHMDDKVELLKKVANAIDVDLSKVFG